jgi:hypothetical protein
MRAASQNKLASQRGLKLLLNGKSEDVAKEAMA